MQGRMQKNRISAEIQHLRRISDYYDRLGCVDVARSLRDLATAKEETLEDCEDDENSTGTLRQGFAM